VLGSWPTPLEPAPRLAAAVGLAALWVKRDDLSGLGGGGNKVRKLQYTCAQALCADTSASSRLAENLDHPLGPFLYTVSCMHCMTVSLADGGMGLGTMWGEQTARTMLGEAGFTSIQAAHLDGDIVNTYLIASKG
jgi:hypothetical protein